MSVDRYIPNVELLFIFLGATGFIVSLVINYLDYYYHNSTLNKPELTQSELKRITSKSKSGSFSRLLNAVKALSYNSMDALKSTTTNCTTLREEEQDFNGSVEIN